MKHRIEWLDSARGIAFLMIIYSHISFRNESLMAYFSPIFLTTFFFVSGYLFSHNCSFIEIVEKRFRTLVIPWFLYGLLMIFLAQILSFHKHAPLTVELTEMFKAIRGENDQLWFLLCLFVTSIPFYIFIKHVQKKYLLPLSLMFFLINRTLVTDPIPWYIHLVAPAMFYMTLGYLFKHYEDRFNFLNSFKFLIILLPIYVFEVFLHYHFNENLVSFVSTPYVIDGLIITVTGILLCISASKNLFFLKTFFVFVGSNSLLYFCLHGKIVSLLQKIFFVISSHFNNNMQSSFYVFSFGLIIAIATAIILIFPVIMVNKFFPWSIGKKFNIIRMLIDRFSGISG